MTTSQVTSEEIAKAREFLRDVRAVCRKHGFLMHAVGNDGMRLYPLQDGEHEMNFEYISLFRSEIDLNEG